MWAQSPGRAQGHRSAISKAAPLKSQTDVTTWGVGRGNLGLKAGTGGGGASGTKLCGKVRRTGAWRGRR